MVGVDSGTPENVDKGGYNRDEQWSLQSEMILMTLRGHCIKGGIARQDDTVLGRVSGRALYGVDGIHTSLWYTEH